MVHIRQRRLSAKSRLACLEEQIAKNKKEIEKKVILILKINMGTELKNSRSNEGLC